MAATKTPKAVLISQLVEKLDSAFPATPELPRLELVESVIFAVLRENRSSAEALATLERFKQDYDDDYNELRVSGLREIQNCIGRCVDSEQRGKAIRRFLHQFFDKNYKFQIEGFTKRPFKEVREELKTYEILAEDHHLAYVQVQCRGDHAFPVDARIVETARRLGLVDKSGDAAAVRGILEKNIPKAQIHHAIALMERFVNEICTAESPHCKECPFQKNCPYFLELSQPPKPPVDNKSRELKGKDKQKEPAVVHKGVDKGADVKSSKNSDGTRKSIDTRKGEALVAAILRPPTAQKIDTKPSKVPKGTKSPVAESDSVRTKKSEAKSVSASKSSAKGSKDLKSDSASDIDVTSPDLKPKATAKSEPAKAKTKPASAKPKKGKGK